jgi:hypothetical protein
MAGTAEPVDCWIMMEYRGAWTSHALENNDLSPAVITWLNSSVEELVSRGFKTRPQFIRQQQFRNKEELRLFVALAGEEQPRLYEFLATTHEDFISVDLARLLDDPDSYSNRKVTGERFFVCTNGQRDACCSVQGMPVYAELARRCEDRVWQTTHLGGHRFAATLVSLPAGIVYGRLRRGDVKNLLAAHEAGNLLLPKLRGRSGLDVASQVAENILRERYGNGEANRYGLLESAQQAGVEHRVFIDRITGIRHELRLTLSEQPLKFQAGCGEENLKSRRLYEILD